MSRARKLLAVSVLGILAIASAVATAHAAFGFLTSVQPYAAPVGSDYKIKPLLSVGDQVRRTSNSSQNVQMVGIPDGLGIARENGRRTVYMNHELTRSTVSEPVIGQPKLRGAFVSTFNLRHDGSVTSGDVAYDEVYQENTYVGPIATTDNTTSAFGRFCSGFLADHQVGFSEPVFLTGEESSGADTFDGKGGQSVAVVDGKAYALPKLGRFSKENQVVLPHTGLKTVILVLEDGPATPDSQLYMYVGQKVPFSKNVLRRNGLDNGKLYTFVGGAGVQHEGNLLAGNTTGSWVEIPGADAMTDVQLEAATDAVGAMGFVRIEDGAGNAKAPGQFHFVTTGANFPAGSPYNKLGRLYRLDLNKHNPTAASKLTVIYNADTVIANGGDTALSPDNMEVNGRYVMIQEDGTSESRTVMGSKGRDGSIFRYDLKNNYAAKRVATLAPPGRDGIAVGPGVWESSGIIETTSEFGPNSWLIDVQAHGPSTAPAPGTVEDGQLLLMLPR